MFYDFSLLSYSKNGKFSRPWVAATMRNHYKLTYNDVMTLDFDYLCDEILKFVMSNSSLPKKRFSLRLSSQLVYGLAILHRRKVILIQDEIYANYNGAFMSLVTPRTRRSSGVRRPRRNRQRNNEQPTIDEPSHVTVTIEEEIRNLLNYEVPNVDENELIQLLNRESIVPETSITLLEPPANASHINMPGIDEQDFGPLQLTMENLFPVENPITEFPIQENNANNIHRIPKLFIQPIISIQEPTPEEIVTISSPSKRKAEAGESNLETIRKKSLLDQTIAADVPRVNEINDFVLSSLESLSVPQRNRGIKRKRMFGIVDAENFIPNEIFKPALNNNKIYTKPITYANPTKTMHNTFMFSTPLHQQLSFNLKTLFHWVPSRQTAAIEEALQFFSRNANDGNRDFNAGTGSIGNESAAVRQESYLSQSVDASLTPLLPKSSSRESGPHPLRKITELTEAPANNSMILSTSNDFIQPEIENYFEEQLPSNISIENAYSFSVPENITLLPHDQNVTNQPTEAEKIFEQEINQSSFSPEKIKRFYFEKIKNMWLRGIREFEFAILCPPKDTNKRNAAVAFYLLLKLVKMQSLKIITKADSLEIYKIVILKD